MYSHKKNINLLTAVMAAHGLHDVVVCPGSRNGALVHNFNECPDFRCHSVTDERSAAFVAIGIIEATKRPAAVCVTSGSAVLGTLPAVAEAAMRRLPLLIISADRPAEWIGQLDGQTLPQNGALQPYAPTFVVPEIENESAHWYANRQANEALIRISRNQPTHINLPLSEPLFDFSEPQLPQERIFTELRPVVQSPLSDEILQQISAARLPVLFIGQYENALPDIEKLEAAHHILILPEHLANVAGAWRTAVMEYTDALTEFQPDLILHAGGNLVHKRTKLMLRQAASCPVIRIDEDGLCPDTFYRLQTVVRAGLPEVVQQLCRLTSPKPEVVRWKETLEAHKIEARQLNFLSPEDHTALRAVNLCCSAVQQQENASLHLANSSTVRMASRFIEGGQCPVHCNRGTNGIEGTLSTAAGHSLVTSGSTFVILGDLSFFYDCNALCDPKLSGNLRILLINNGGGAIFHHLPGLSNSPALEQFIAAEHGFSARGLADTYGLHYKAVNPGENLEEAIDFLTHHEATRPVLVEVFTNL